MPTSSSPTRSATLRKGAIAPWAKSSSPYYMQTLDALGKHYKFTLDTKWKDLPKKAQEAILYGSGEDARSASPTTTACAPTTTKKPFEGVITNLERRCKETESDWAREEIAQAISPTSPATPATAIGSSPRRCA